GRPYLLFFRLGMKISAASGLIGFSPSVLKRDPICPLKREIVASVTEAFGAAVRTPGATVFVVEVTVGDAVALTGDPVALVPGSETTCPAASWRLAERGSTRKKCIMS